MINVTKPDLAPIEEVIPFLNEIWESRWLTNGGKFVTSLEERLRNFLGLHRQVACVSNGTLALQLAIKALSLKGNVVTTPFTFAATTNVLLWEGIEPKFAEIDPETLNLSPEHVGEVIDENTSAILSVHVFGNGAGTNELVRVAEKHSIPIIFDSAHAFGVEYEGKSLFDYGDVSTASFHATKVFNTFEGGAIFSKNSETHDKVRLLRNFGIRSEEEIAFPGINGKMNEFQAAIGLANLTHISDWINKRKALYETYISELAKFEQVSFQKVSASKFNYGYMPVIFRNKEIRDKIATHLIEHKFQPRKYFYPSLTHLSYSKKEWGETPVSDEISGRILTLPLYSTLTERDVYQIVSIIGETIGSHTH